jgi:hypothetical protein
MSQKTDKKYPPAAPPQDAKAKGKGPANKNAKGKEKEPELVRESFVTEFLWDFHLWNTISI